MHDLTDFLSKTEEHRIWLKYRENPEFMAIFAEMKYLRLRLEEMIKTGGREGAGLYKYKNALESVWSMLERDYPRDFLLGDPTLRGVHALLQPPTGPGTETASDNPPGHKGDSAA